MKLETICPLIVAATILCGCSSTNFTEYRGPAVIEGKGGTVKVVDGIDFWENGEPDRKYKILGVIDDSRADGLIQRLGQDSSIAKTARERGGDGVILSGSSREFRGVNLNSGAANYRRMTKVIVVKYVD
jgi:hypothetical protein